MVEHGHDVWRVCGGTAHVNGGKVSLLGSISYTRGRGPCPAFACLPDSAEGTDGWIMALFDVFVDPWSWMFVRNATFAVIIAPRVN